MHVLITADSVGGVWTYARELVTGLSRQGVRVTLVSFGEIPTPAQMEWLDGLRGVDFHPTGFRLEWMQDSASDIESSREFLLGLVDELRPDLLHLNQFCYGSLPVKVPRLVVAHSDVVSWWENVNGAPPPADEWTNWYRRTVSEGLMAADVVAAPSRWMLETVTRIYAGTEDTDGASPWPGKTAVIYNGRNPALFNPHCSKRDMVLTVGRIWDAGKQASLLTEADSDAPVCIVGQQQHADEKLRTSQDALTTQARRLEFRGPQTEGQLRILYGEAGIYAATSRYEPFGLAPLEAALSRCAVVANDIPSFRELWGHTAYYFRRNDAASLREAVARLRADRSLRLTFANLAYNRARQRFTASRMVDEYLALYRAMIAKGASAPLPAANRYSPGNSAAA